jgi:type I restriction enzyme S subunit
VAIGRGIGRVAIVPEGLEFCINQSVAVLWFPDKANADLSFLMLAVRAPLTQVQIARAAEGAAIKHISITDFEIFPFPLPPLAEQTRIVRKVDRLMAICDELEAGLAKSREEGARLLEAAVAGVGK